MSDPDRRQSSRVVAGARCWCEDGEVTLYSTVGNLSEGGLFVRTFAPLPRGRQATVSFELSHGRRIQAEAQVMWRREASAGGPPSGMGLAFTRLQPEHRERIRRFVRSGDGPEV